MSRYIGNYLRVPSSEPQQSSAPGIWSINEQLAYQRANLWPPARDPYYNQTVLHLSGDVAATRETNPVTQPRTFLSDASTNNFLLIPNGDVSARPFSPYASSYSNYFDGTGDYLSVAANSAFDFASGNFTIEAWINKLSSTYSILFDFQYWYSYNLRINSNNAILSASYTPAGSENWNITSANNIIIPNIWNHVALVRNGSSIRIYVNGNSVASGTFAGSISNTVSSLRITHNDSGVEGTGYISNLRIVKGTAVYTTNFTPPTTPLENIAGTSLLTCQANRFKDNSSNNFTVTRAGDVAVAQNSPFVEYDTTSGSAYFDGTGDYLTSTQASAFTFNADFTIEFWWYPTTLSTDYQDIVATANNATYMGANIGGWVVSTTSNNILRFGYQYNNSWVVDNTFGTSNIIANAWNYIAISRSGSTIRGFVNGTVGSSTATYGSTINSTTYGPYIGIGAPTSATTRGYITDVRINKGTAVYTGSFTPPTKSLARSGTDSAASYPSTTNVNTSFAESTTSLLTLQTRAPANNQGILDTSPNRFEVTRTGNVAQGSFSPFSASGYSVSTTATNTLDLPGSVLAFGSSSFTVEAWVYATHVSGAPIVYPYNSGNAVTSGGFSVSFGTGGVGYYAVNGATPINYSATIPINTWYHLALVKDGTAARLYLNGQLVATGTDSTTYTTPTGGARVGGIYNLTQTYGLVVNNLRIVTGQALYNANFTPATTNLTASVIGHQGLENTPITGTVRILTARDAYRIDRSPNNHTIGSSGSPQFLPISPFAPTQAYVASQLGGSLRVSASGDIISWPQNTWNNRFSSNNWSIEAWVYPTASTSTDFFVDQWTNGTTTTSLIFTFMGGNFDVYIGSTLYTLTGITPTLNAWTHIVAVRTGGTFSVFQNGVRTHTRSDLGAGVVNNGGTANRASPGFGGGAGCFFHGHRIVIGSNVPYDATNTIISIPTAPVTAISGTASLLLGTGAGIVDSTGRNVVETVGNSAVQTTQSKWSPGSMLFNGTTSYLKSPASPAFNCGTGNWTIEGWVYISSYSTNFPLIIGNNNGTFSAGALGFTTQNAGNNKFSLAVYDINSGAAALVASPTNSINTWYYVALVRNGTSLIMYRDGASVASMTISAGITFDWGKSGLLIGGASWDGAASYFNGYIDDIRLTNGYARYATGTGGNAGQMVFNGTNTLALPTVPFPLA